MVHAEAGWNEMDAKMLSHVDLPLYDTKIRSFYHSKEENVVAFPKCYRFKSDTGPFSALSALLCKDWNIFKICCA